MPCLKKLRKHHKKRYTLKYITSGVLGLILLLSVLTISCRTTHSVHNDLENNIAKVIKLFTHKSSDINEMIHSETGVFIVYRPGAFNTYLKINTIDFNTPNRYLPHADVEPAYNMNYESLPTYSCSEEKWSKTGLYCDLTTRDYLLSTTAYNLEKYELGTIDNATMEAFKILEQNSHRVVLTDKDDNALIFYLTRIKSKWYLTILDTVSGDCSA
ncbi:MAG: hypothetical protein AAF934_03090 [Bacteroidota bacterium]